MMSKLGWLVSLALLSACAAPTTSTTVPVTPSSDRQVLAVPSRGMTQMRETKVVKKETKVVVRHARKPLVKHPLKRTAKPLIVKKETKVVTKTVIKPKIKPMAKPLVKALAKTKT